MKHRRTIFRPAPLTTRARPGKHRQPTRPRVLTLASALRAVVAR